MKKKCKIYYQYHNFLGALLRIRFSKNNYIHQLFYSYLTSPIFVIYCQLFDGTTLHITKDLTMF